MHVVIRYALSKVSELQNTGVFALPNFCRDPTPDITKKIFITYSKHKTKKNCHQA